MSKASMIGLGLMGSALARVLLLSGHDITVWNRTREKMEPIIADGAHGASSLAEAVQASPIVLVSVSNYEMTSKLLGANDVVRHLCTHTVVQFSSGMPKETLESERWFNNQDANYLDGAILGGPGIIGTETGQILICGQAQAWKNCQPVLKCLAGNVQYLGDNIRAASTLDLAWLTQRYGLFISVAHALILCEAEGVDADEFAKTVAVGDRAKMLAEVVHTDDFSNPSATLSVWKAALEHIRGHAHDTKINTEFPDFVSNLLGRAEDAGYGEEDVVAIIKVLRSGNAA